AKEEEERKRLVTILEPVFSSLLTQIETQNALILEQQKHIETLNAELEEIRSDQIHKDQLLDEDKEKRFEWMGQQDSLIKETQRSIQCVSNSLVSHVSTISAQIDKLLVSDEGLKKHLEGVDLKTKELASRRGEEQKIIEITKEKTEKRMKSMEVTIFEIQQESEKFVLDNSQKIKDLVASNSTLCSKFASISDSSQSQLQQIKTDLSVVQQSVSDLKIDVRSDLQPSMMISISHSVSSLRDTRMNTFSKLRNMLEKLSDCEKVWSSLVATVEPLQSGTIDSLNHEEFAFVLRIAKAVFESSLSTFGLEIPELEDASSECSECESEEHECSCHHTESEEYLLSKDSLVSLFKQVSIEYASIQNCLKVLTDLISSFEENIRKLVHNTDEEGRKGKCDLFMKAFLEEHQLSQQIESFLRSFSSIDDSTVSSPREEEELEEKRIQDVERYSDLKQKLIELQEREKILIDSGSIDELKQIEEEERNVKEEMLKARELLHL
ncbi:hypothetical protein ADUPG1_011106, partial [Aduncisulcus paluster]